MNIHVHVVFKSHYNSVMSFSERQLWILQNQGSSCLSEYMHVFCMCRVVLGLLEAFYKHAGA